MVLHKINVNLENVSPSTGVRNAFLAILKRKTLVKIVLYCIIAFLWLLAAHVVHTRIKINKQNSEVSSQLTTIFLILDYSTLILFAITCTVGIGSLLQFEDIEILSILSLQLEDHRVTFSYIDCGITHRVIIISLPVLIFVYLIYDTSVICYHYEWAIAQSFLFGNILFYTSILFLLVVEDMVIKTIVRYNALNNELKNIIEDYVQQNNPSIMKLHRIVERLRLCRKYNNLICNSVHKINDICGPVLLFSVIMLAMDVLFEIDFVVEYTGNPKLLKHLANPSNMAVVSTSWIAIGLVLVFYVSYTGHCLMTEHKVTLGLCQQFLSKLMCSSNQSEDKLIRREIESLSEQLINKTPNISALDVFYVDLSLFGNVFSFFVKYTIVILQLQKVKIN